MQAREACGAHPQGTAGRPDIMGCKGNHRPFTSDEDRQVLAFRAQGLTFDALAAHLGRSGESCRGRYNKLVHAMNWQMDHASGDCAKPHSKQRLCMCCHGPFWSSGPGNRLCVDCKRRDSDEPYHLLL